MDPLCCPALSCLVLSSRPFVAERDHSVFDFPLPRPQKHPASADCRRSSFSRPTGRSNVVTITGTSSILSINPRPKLEISPQLPSFELTERNKLLPDVAFWIRTLSHPKPVSVPFAVVESEPTFLAEAIPTRPSLIPWCFYPPSFPPVCRHYNKHRGAS